MDRRPILIDTKYGSNIYNTSDLNLFFNPSNINYIKTDITNNVLYILSKTISQDKLRNAGFIITRDIDKANVIVITDFINNLDRYSYGVKGTSQINTKFNIEDFFDKFNIKYNYILDVDLYKYLYKYEGNQELFYQTSDLLKSKSSDNIKIAMEFISNANWIGNEIYLQEIFNLYYTNYMRGNSYKNSISFKGFLSSLEFNYGNLYLNNADDYRKLCVNDEHHQWIYNKYEEEFKEELDDLVKKHKIKLDVIKYSIDKELIYEDTLEEG